MSREISPSLPADLPQLTPADTFPFDPKTFHPEIAQAWAAKITEEKRIELRQRLRQANQAIETGPTPNRTMTRVEFVAGALASLASATLGAGMVRHYLDPTAEIFPTRKSGSQEKVINLKPPEALRHLNIIEQMTTLDDVGTAVTPDGMLFIPSDKLHATGTGSLQNVEITYSQISPDGVSLQVQKRDETNSVVNDANNNPVMVNPSMRIKKGGIRGAQEMRIYGMNGWGFPLIPLEVDKDCIATVVVEISRINSNGERPIQERFPLRYRTTFVEDDKSPLKVISQVSQADFPQLKEKSQDLFNTLRGFEVAGYPTHIYITPNQTVEYLSYDNSSPYSSPTSGFVISRDGWDDTVIPNIIHKKAVDMVRSNYYNAQVPPVSNEIFQDANLITEINEGYDNQETIDTVLLAYVDPGDYLPTLSQNPYTAALPPPGPVPVQFANWLTVIASHPELLDKEYLSNHPQVVDFLRGDDERRHFDACRNLYDILDPNHTILTNIHILGEVLESNGRIAA